MVSYIVLHCARNGAFNIISDRKNVWFIIIIKFNTWRRKKETRKKKWIMLIGAGANGSYRRRATFTRLILVSKASNVTFVENLVFLNSGKSGRDRGTTNTMVPLSNSVFPFHPNFTFSLSFRTLFYSQSKLIIDTS